MKTPWQIILERRWQAFYRNPYQHLLLSLLLIFLGFTVINEDSSLGAISLSALFLLTVLFVIETFNLKRRFLNLFKIIAIISFLLSSYIAWIETTNLWVITLMNRLIQGIFLVSAVFVILKRIFEDKRVTGDTLTGGISVYMMLGLAWFELYEILLLYDSQAFSQKMEFYRTFYFSFVTLTTVGYGDIVPIHKVAMILANLEAIMGQLYPAIIIARLVSLYTHEKEEVGK